MRYPAAVVAGLLAAGMIAAPAQAAPAEGSYWRVEVTRTAEHPHPVGTGYRLTQRSVRADWLTPEGKGWHAYRELGAFPATKKDEADWRADGSPTSWTYRVEGMKISLSTKPGKGSLRQRDSNEDGFRLGEKEVTYNQLQTLPADPAALRAQVTAEVRAWMEEAAEEAKTTSPKSAIDDWLVNLDHYVAKRMTGLLYENPVPFKVRSAAFQALKATKGVSDLGTAKDPLGRTGHKIALPVPAQKSTVKEHVIVDTKTMTLLASYVDITAGGKPVAGKSGVETYKVGWTDAKPAIPAAR